jgi:cell division protein FtsI (penicillin-binding protein 3)
LRLGRPALRLRIAFVVMAFVLSLFAGRLVLLQGVDPDSYALAAAKENTQSYALHASRGSILDRDGVPLAVSDDAVAIVADPKQTAPVAQQLATILSSRMTSPTYDDMVTKLLTPNSRFERVARKVSPQVWSQIKAEMKDRGLVGLYTQPDPVRSHPNGDVAANVVGYVGAEGNGLGGLEYSLDKQLSGQDGKAIYEVDARGNRIPLANHTVAEPKPGLSAQLTIDRDLQWYAQQRIAQQVKLMKAESGSVVTIDVKTGEVLVAATYPSFDPDKAGTATSDARGNRILEQVYEPGSVQKVVTMAALADAGEINLNTKVQVPPSIRISGKTIHDHFSHGHLNLTISGVVAKSSNLGTIVVARRLPIPRFVKYLYDFGFGRPTGTNFPGESRGLMPPGDEWSELTRSNVAFGQGISANALQMAAAVNTVANGGVYVAPRLVRNFVDSSGNVVPAAAPGSRRVVSAAAAKQVTTMMEAVTGPGGTAKTAQIPGYRVAGKTGTAQEVDSRCGCYRRWATSFVGFAPADNPRFVTYVVLQNPTNGRSGGGQGGPVFRDVMNYALQKYAVPPTGAKAPNTPLTW